MGRWFYGSLGAVLGAVAAICISLVLAHPKVESSLPLLFLVFIFFIAIKFGRIAGITGTIAASLVFASFLPPRWSLAVANRESRAHLIWMLLCGIIFSDLLGAYVQPRRGQHRHL